MEKMEKMKAGAVCVTGAGGFAASWLVKLLLSKGFLVHGTVRDPYDDKYAHLKRLAGSTEKLKLFKADLLDFSSIASAVAGCEGVFHVASPVPSTKVSNPEVELLAPAVTGTQNVLKACKEANIKRVVLVSSVVAITMKPDWPKGEPMDETSWSDELYCRTTENWYCLSKTLAEREAFDFASRNAMDVVTVCPSLIIGPMLQKNVNASSLVLINLLKGIRESVDNVTRHVVDVRDLADAMLLIYQKEEASGRYLASSHSITTRDLVDHLKRLFPNMNYPKFFNEVEQGKVISSKKLKNLGWKIRPLEDTLKDAVEYYQSTNLLE